MGVFKICILLFLYLGYVESGCPSPESIAPFCKCRIIGDGDYEEAHLHCDHVLSPQDLVAPIRTISAKNLKIFALSINNSSLQYIPSGIFLGCHIEKVRFLNTQIMSLSDSDTAFEGLEDMLVDLRATDAHYIAQWDWQQLRKLEKLDLIDVNFIVMGSIDEPFPHLPKLTALGITNAEISFIEDKAFSELPSLRILNMKENKITELKRNMLPDPAENLLIMDFSFNELSSLPKDFFTNMPSLDQLSLENNKFITLTENPFRSLFDSVSELFMKDNPFKCDCRLRWLVGARFPNNFNGACVFPAELKGQKISTLDLRSLHC